ncbi:MAG: hypothetical protein ACE5HI_10265 [bacterium]
MARWYLNLKYKLEDCREFTLIEVVLIIVILAIAIPALMDLLSSTLVDSNKSVILSKAMIYAQEKMEQIIADKKSTVKGYDWVTTPGNYQDDVPASGFTRNVVIETSGKIQNGIPHALVQVVVSHDKIPDVMLTTWLTDY